MGAIPASEVRSFVTAELAPKLSEQGIDPGEAPDDLDLIEADLVDSLGLLELIADIEHRFSVEVDFEDADPDELTRLGELCRIVAEQGKAPASS
jgi:acyl carrier protein